MMHQTYYTNFIKNSETGNIVLMEDYPTAAESIRAAAEYADIEGIEVERVGPRSTSPLFTTDDEFLEERIAY